MSESMRFDCFKLWKWVILGSILNSWRWLIHLGNGEFYDWEMGFEIIVIKWESIVGIPYPHVDEQIFKIRLTLN